MSDKANELVKAVLEGKDPKVVLSESRIEEATWLSYARKVGAVSELLLDAQEKLDKKDPDYRQLDKVLNYLDQASRVLERM